MFLVEGHSNGKKMYASRLTSVTVTATEVIVSGLKKFKLSDVISVDIVGQEFKTTKGGGVTGAGAGAVLGFLVAGPLGTAVGAGLGSRSKQVGRDNTTISISFRNGDSLVCDYAKPADIGKLKGAVAKNLSSPIKNTEPKKQKKIKKDAITKQVAKRRKPPHSDAYRNTAMKGRDSIRNSKDKRQPNLPNFGKLSELSQENLLHKNILDVLDKYNLYIWSRFDATISLDQEVSAIASRVLQNVLTLSNQKQEFMKQIENSEISIEKTTNAINSLELQKKEAENKLAQANFFSKGKFRDEISVISVKIEKEKVQLPTYKRKKTAAAKQLKELGELIHLHDLDSQINEIGKKLSPKIKLNPNLKKSKKIDNQFFLEIYISVFNELEDKRVKEEQIRLDKDYESRLAEHKANKKDDHEKKVTKSISSSKSNVKERLNQLKGLLDDGIIEKDEYEDQRKRILESL